MKRGRRTLVTAVIVSLILALVLLWSWVLIPRRVPAAFASVDIPKGAGAFQIARLLADNGVIQNPVQFLLVRAVRPKARLMAGEYVFDSRLSPWVVFDRIARGDVFYYPLLVPEGSSIFDIAQLLRTQKVMDAAAFLKVAQDPALIRDLDPRALTLEGYLFPDTYYVTGHTTPEQLCRLMTGRFREVWKGLAPAGVNVHDTVVLASMVEREAKLASERPLIASVFLNRLRLGMPLQCDPTAAYAAQLEDRYHGTIDRSDLNSKHLYNTYQHAGLPPGPIANPGVPSLKAVLAPASTDYLYFVARADDTGGHQFSKELAQHSLAVEKYRRGLRNQTQQTHRALRLH